MTVAILLLAGASTRFGAKNYKQLHELKGKPVFLYSFEKLNESPLISKVVLVVNDEVKNEVSKYVNNANFVKGGNTRQESVKNALDSLNLKEEDIVLIHDAARPLIDQEIIKNVIEDAQKYDAATAYIPETNTIALRSCDGMINRIENRDRVAVIQTPQAFKFGLIKEAHQKANDIKATDDTSILLALNKEVKLTLGKEKYRKITTVDDLKIIEGMIEND